MARSREPLVMCLNLRSKEMLYEDPRKEADEPRGGFEGTAYWCQCTQTGRGPDDKPANRRDCSSPGRSCYVGLEDLT